MEAPYALHEFEGYKLGKTIGKGSMGKVKIATNQEGVQYACKIIKRSQQDITKDYLHKYQFMKDLETKELDDIRTIREMAINLLFDHPYIVTIHKVFVTNYHFYIIMDLVNGTQVLDFIISHGKLKEKFAMNLFAQLISAVEYCHLNSIVHRDLKIENILIDSKGFMQLIDFGLANLYSNHSYLNTFCGSLYFAAPELLSGRKYIGPEVDIWSLGVILYVLTCGKVPFDDAYLPALNQKIMNGQVDYPSHLSPNIKNLLSKMLVVKPFKRATIEQIKAHPWFVKGCKFNSFLPERKKIEHIDDEVVKRMGGFRFGSEDKIKEKLAVDIMSDELEPIVSIYRLVSEKMQRPDYKYKIANPTRIVSAEVLDKESKKKPKSKKSIIPLRRTRSLEGGEKASRARFRKKRDDDPRRESMFGTIKHRMMSLRSNKDKDDAHDDHKNNSDHKHQSDHQQSKITFFSKAISGFFTGKKSDAEKGSEKGQKSKVEHLTIPINDPGYVPFDISEENTTPSSVDSSPIHKPDRNSLPAIKPQPHMIPNESAPFRRIKTAGQIKIPEEIIFGNSIFSAPVLDSDIDNIVSAPITIQRSKTTIESIAYTSPTPAPSKPSSVERPRSRTSIMPRRHTNELQKDHELPQNPIENPIGYITDQIEKISFAGLFSVSTTSTRSLPKMRRLLLEAILKLKSEMQLSYSERKGMIILLINSTGISNTSVDAVNRPLSSNSDGLRLENLTAEGDPGVDGVGSGFVKLEILLGKVRMMKLHCVMFKKLEGDSIKYKEICERFLHILHW